MEETFYTKEHFWVCVEGDIVTVGLTDYILRNFNIVSAVNLSQASTVCEKTGLVGSIIYDEDSIFEIFSPFSGEIVEINDLLIDNPEQLSSSVKENNWLLRIFINNREELEDLISEEEYNEYIDEI
jgi:glycine cleavage system H protein